MIWVNADWYKAKKLNEYLTNYTISIDYDKK